MPFEGIVPHRRAAEIASMDKAVCWLADRARWLQGGYQSRDGRQKCVAAAVFTGDPSVDTRVYGMLANLIERRHGVQTCIGNWNDAPDRTHAEVLQLIAEARAAFEAEDAHG